MLVSELIGLMRNSEVAQIKIGEDDAAMLGFVNLAILEVHKEFKLQNREATITIGAGPERNYTLDGLDSNVAITLTGHELLNIEDIYNEYGQTLRINDPVDKCGVNMPTFQTLYFKDEDLEAADEYLVTYRAAPDFLTAVTDTIPVTSAFTEALTSFAAYKAHKSVSGKEQTEHMKHYKAYLGAIDVIRRRGVVQEDSMESNNFYTRGFV